MPGRRGCEGLHATKAQKSLRQKALVSLRSLSEPRGALYKVPWREPRVLSRTTIHALKLCGMLLGTQHLTEI